MTFLFAGHETSATALTWALYELGRNPGVARRLRGEVDEVVARPHTTLADLPVLGFDPSRWDGIDEPPGDRPEYAYFPFGGGPRHCIGMRFACMELKLALATIARRCRVTHGRDEVAVDVGSTVAPGETVHATVRRRD